MHAGGDLCRAAAKAFSELLTVHPNCTYLTGANATLVTLPAGYFHLPLPPQVKLSYKNTGTGTEGIVSTDRLLMATGGKQNKPDLGVFNEKIMLSDWVQQTGGLSELKEKLAAAPTGNTKEVAIIGGSHSAWSTALLLLDKIDDPDVTAYLELSPPTDTDSRTLSAHRCRL